MSRTKSMPSVDTRDIPAVGLPQVISSLAEPSRIFASPLARRLAGLAGIDVRALAGSGPGGRIVKRDVERRARERREIVASESRDAGEAPARVQGEIERSPGGSRNWSRRQGFRLGGVVCVADALEALKKFGGAGQDGADLSMGAFVVRAASWALRRVPELVMTRSEDPSKSSTDIDIACLGFVGIQPIDAIVRNADRMGLRAVHAELRGRGSANGRETKWSETEPEPPFKLAFLDGADVLDYEIVATEGVALAISGIGPRTLARGDSAVVLPCLTASLTAGPAAADPIHCSRFLAEFRAAMERPIRMIL